MKHMYTLLDIHPLSLNLHMLKCWLDAQIMWHNIWQNQNIKLKTQIPGFNQITIWGLQTDKATGGYCLAFFPLYVICLCPFPQGSLAISAFHFPFICMLFVAAVTKWNNWYMGGGREADMPAVTALRYFHVCRKFMEICWAARNMDFCLKAKNNNKKQQQPRLIKKKLVWELLRISIWTQSLRMRKSHTHTVLFLEGLFECAKDRAKKVFF